MYLNSGHQSSMTHILLKPRRSEMWIEKAEMIQ